MSSNIPDSSIPRGGEGGITLWEPSQDELVEAGLAHETDMLAGIAPSQRSLPDGALAADDPLVAACFESFEQKSVATDKSAGELRKKITLRQFTIRADKIVCHYLRGLSDVYPKDWLPAYLENGTLPTLQQLKDDGVLHVKASKGIRHLPDDVSALVDAWTAAVEELRVRPVLDYFKTKEGGVAKLVAALYPKLWRGKRDMVAIAWELGRAEDGSLEGGRAKDSIMKYCAALASIMKDIEATGANARHALWPPNVLEQGMADILEEYDVEQLDPEDL